MSNRLAQWLLGFVAVLEAANVGVALIANRGTLPAVDLLFTSTGGAVLVEALRQQRQQPPNPPSGGTP